MADRLFTFFITTTPTFIYGLNSKINVGIRPRLRRTLRTNHPTFLDLISSSTAYNSNNSYARTTITGCELILRHPMNIGNSKITLQHQVGIPMRSDNEGNVKKAYIDWNGLSLSSQLFYSYYRNSYQVFVDFGYRFDNITRSTIFGLKQFFTYASLPLTVLPGYSMSSRNHIYVLLQYSARWAIQNQAANYYDPFHQYGLGYKLFFLKNYEIEFIGTRFFTSDNEKKAYTFNLGLRKIFGRDLY